MYDHLFSEGRINGVTLKNRIVMSGMDPGFSVHKGIFSDREIKYLAERAKGGCGLIITGYTAVVGEEKCGISHAGQTVIEDTEHFKALILLAEAIHNQNSKIFLQITHPGKAAKPALNRGQRPKSSSLVVADGKVVAEELTVPEIQEIVKAFGNAAHLAYEAGMDGVEVHCCHGDLLEQFLSPGFNFRKDMYGGCLENRARIVVEVIQEIRKQVPRSFPVALRMDYDDGTGALDIDLAVEHAKYLSQVGIDALDISTNPHLGINNPRYTIEPPSSPEGSKREFVKKIKDAVKNIPIISTSNVKSPEAADKLIADGINDFVSLGRAQIADPEFANKAKYGKADQITPCISCNMCQQLGVIEGKQLRCSVNPRAGKEIDFPAPAKNGNGRLIVVIGAGPGGLAAARLASERGFKVELYEKSDRLGGCLYLASRCPSKGDKITNLLAYYGRMIKQFNINLHLNTEVTIEELEKMDPYAIVLAAGGKPIIPPVPGVDQDNIYLAPDILSGRVVLKDKKIALIGGGLTGLEVAEYLLETNDTLKIFDMFSVPYQGVPAQNTEDFRRVFKERGVELKLRHRLEEIRPDQVVFTDLETGETANYECDTVVLALGVRTDNSLYKQLSEKFERVLQVGDSNKPGKIYNATSDGYGKIYTLE